MRLSIEHETIYAYRKAVRFNPHRLMIRAIEGHDVQIRDSGLIIEPKAQVRWRHDIFGNSVAVAEFAQPRDRLRVFSRLVVEQYNTNPFDFVIQPSACELPFEYETDERIDAGPFLGLQHPEDESAVRHWLKPFLSAKGGARTLEFLTAVNRSAPLFFQYIRREEAGVQSPAETIRKRSGSCRDFALLLMEGARAMGVAARFVSGYLCQSDEAEFEAGLGATHAWAEVYLPGAGWRGFDPTCGILAADHHVRVAVVREPSQATPVEGTFSGSNNDYAGLSVNVTARVEEKGSNS